MIGPRRQLPPGPGEFFGDRNGEPSEADWVGCFLVICIVALLAIVAMVTVAALFPADRVYFSNVGTRP